MRWALALLLLAPALSGCILAELGGSDPGTGDDGVQPGGNSTIRPPGARGNGTLPGTAGNATGTGNGTGANVSVERIWPDIALASIRPGSSIDDGECTTNFVFTSLDNRSTYLGTAAHCFSNDANTQTDGCLANVQKLGTKRSISGASKSATLVYSSWSAMQAANETGDVCRNNDFALLELHPDDAEKVHPALWRFGGPTGIAATRDVSSFDRVLSYGNSNLRPEDSALSPREGYVTLPAAGGCDTRVVFPNPAVPGDSGSPVLLADGLALGVFVSIELTPLAGQGHVCLLSTILSYAAGAGFPVQLATWELIDDGTLPP